jgi:AcrR family transcriptional regulator
MKREHDHKRERALSAAQECFVQYGFKRTSMDDIAQKADISRAALYLLFPNKEAIFRTLSQQLHDAALDRAAAALQSHAALTDRLRAAFEGKMLEFLRLVQESPHGAELADLDHGIGADIAQAADNQFRELLVNTLENAARDGDITFDRIGADAGQCAKLLLLAVRGLKSEWSGVEVYHQQLAQLVQVFGVALAKSSTK